MDNKPTQSVLEAFNITDEPVFLPGGEERTYRAGNTVLKHIGNDNASFTGWTEDIFSSIKEDGFRVPRPLKTKEGTWMTPDGWSAWTFLEGNHNFEGRVSESKDAIQAFHKALKDIPKPDFLGTEDSSYMRADRYAWDDKPEHIHPDVKEDVELLYSLRQQIDVEDQLIHGDLNPDNILLSDNFPPAIIDIAPYWRPAEFGLAIYAYWIAGYRNRPELLDAFKNIPNFKQHLVRAGIRNLLIMSEFDKVHELEKYRKATEIIKDLF